jgi:hypothetical protein
MRGKRRDGTPGLRDGWGMDFCKFNLGLYAVEIMASIVLFQKVGCIQVIFCLPRIVGFRISFPLKEILELFVLPKVAMASDGFYFIFCFSINKVWWRSCEVGAMGICFDVWG